MDDGRVEAADLLGRIVARAPGRALRDAVVRDVVAEAQAVRSAGAGDLGRTHAAAVATLRWLRAAAWVSAALVGHAAADVIALAEAIEHEDPPIARQVLERVLSSSDVGVVRDVLQEATRERPGVDPRLTGPAWVAQPRDRFAEEVRRNFRAVR